MFLGSYVALHVANRNRLGRSHQIDRNMRGNKLFVMRLTTKHGKRCLEWMDTSYMQGNTNFQMKK